MKYYWINPHESHHTTLPELEKNYSENYPKRLNAFHCKIYKRGQYWVIAQKNKVLYYEYCLERFPFFEDAIHLMNPAEFAKWKTVANLISFRQALREDVMNWRCLADMLDEPLSEKVFLEYMKLSRAADLRHHGQHTF